MSVGTSSPDDAAGSAADHVEFVRVHLGDETYGFELGRVDQLVRRPSLTRVPRTASTIAGVTEIQGNVTAAIDGWRLLETAPREADDQPRILVVFTPSGDDRPVGILVDRIDGIEAHAVDVIEPATTAEAGPDDRDRDWFKAVVDGETPVFDPDELIDAARSDH